MPCRSVGRDRAQQAQTHPPEKLRAGFETATRATGQRERAQIRKVGTSRTRSSARRERSFDRQIRLLRERARNRAIRSSNRQRWSYLTQSSGRRPRDRYPSTLRNNRGWQENPLEDVVGVALIVAVE